MLLFRRFCAALFAACLLMPLPLRAADSVFPDYAAYEAFVSEAIRTRQFGELIARLGGRDEYTALKLQDLETRMRGAFPTELTESTVFNRSDMGGGVGQEGRIFWSDRGGFFYYYALLLDRGDDLVVLYFAVNSAAMEIMSKF